MSIVDEFVLNHTLQSLQKQIGDNQSQASLYYQENDASIQDLTSRISAIETNEDDTGVQLGNITSFITDFQHQLADLNAELVKTKRINLKQEIVIRTLHNLEAFSGTDMYADTFANGESIDWNHSVRAELLTDYQAIGRTQNSVVAVGQDSVPSFNLISKNGTSDEAMYQTFLVDKDRQIDKVSLYIEPYNQNTWQPLTVSIHATETGSALTSADLRVEDAIGWVDIQLPAYVLAGNQEYQVRIETEDVYGYKVGMDVVDRYLPGTSFSRFGSAWTDNNYDIGFKVWCFPAADEVDAVVLTLPKIYPTLPEYIVFESEETNSDGVINYFVSRDNGLNWKLLQSSIETNLNDLPEGYSVILKAVITGSSRIEAWGYVIRRSDIA